MDLSHGSTAAKYSVGWSFEVLDDMQMVIRSTGGIHKSDSGRGGGADPEPVDE